MHMDPEGAGGMRGSRIFCQRGPTLTFCGSFAIFQGIRTSIAKKT